MMKLVILDRDGVINQDSDNFIKSPEEWIPIPGSLEAIALLNQHGFRVVVATNQSGIARGLFDMVTLNTIHDKMQHAVAQAGGHIDAIFYCPHAASDNCECRKPKTKMIEDIGERYGIDLKNVPAVGDALRDLEAFKTVGCQPMLVETGKGKATLATGKIPAKTLIFPNLAKAADYIIKEL
jgi:D-glycero-D-manno-heptose 1,7-bisphosphate phosphatase